MWLLLFLWVFEQLGLMLVCSYNAPEVGFEGRPDSSNLDFRKCDAWSFGILCLETLRNGAFYMGDTTVMTMISQCSVPSVSSGSNGVSWSNSMDSTESLTIKKHISYVAISLSKRIHPPASRINFMHTFRHCLCFEAGNRLADLSILPLLVPGV
jgi:hypothetical protein